MKLLEQGERLPAIFNRFIASKLPHGDKPRKVGTREWTFMGYTHKVLPWRHVECGLHTNTPLASSERKSQGFRRRVEHNCLL